MNKNNSLIVFGAFELCKILPKKVELHEAASWTVRARLTWIDIAAFKAFVRSLKSISAIAAIHIIQCCMHY